MGQKARITLLAVWLFAPGQTLAQGNAEHALHPPEVPEAPAVEGVLRQTAFATRRPSRTVYGWFPSWVWKQRADGTWPPEPRIRWDLLTHLSYFHVRQAADGTLGGLSVLQSHAYLTLREQAKQNGVKITLTVTNFAPSEIAAIVSPAVRQQAIDAIIAATKSAGAEGVNIDYEMVGASASRDFSAFMRALTTQMHAAIPGSHVTLAGPTLSARASYDYDALLEGTDGIIPMFYGCTGAWKGSVAGPNAPLNAGFPGISAQCNLQWVIDDYLQYGKPQNRHKVFMGLPFFGNRWSVPSDTLGAAPLSAASAVTFRQVAPLYATQRQWEEISATPYAHQADDAGHAQTWVDDGESLDRKLQAIVAKDLGGIGIFALGYEGDSDAYWDAIARRLAADDSGENHAPVAVIAPLAAIAPGERVTLDGRGSFDLDGDALTYAWRQLSGPEVVLALQSDGRASFVPAALGTYTFSLSVSDGRTSSTTTRVSVSVSAEGSEQEDATASSNGAPQARIRASHRTLVTLDGSASADPEGAPLSYRWRQVSGPALETSLFSDAPTLQFPVRQVGTYVFGLVVFDGERGSDEAQASLDVALEDDLQAPGVFTTSAAAGEDKGGCCSGAPSALAAWSCVAWLILRRGRCGARSGQTGDKPVS